MNEIKDITCKQLLKSCLIQEELISKIKRYQRLILELEGDLESEQMIIEDICLHDTVIKWTEYGDYYEGRNRTYHKCVICGKNTTNSPNIVTLNEFSKEKVSELKEDLIRKWSTLNENQTHGRK